MTSANAGRYPRTIQGEAGDLELRYMTATDEPAVLAFARALPDHDLLFLPRDIAQPKVLAAWIAEVERGALTTLLAARSGTLVGCATIVAQMTVDQRGAIAVFESIGFRGEALLRDHVKDRSGIKHDLVILSHDVARFQSQMEAYGASEAP